MNNQDKYYGEAYENIFGDGAVGFVSKLVHRSIEKGESSKHYEKILELGAGHGQHFRFVKSSYTLYYETDIRVENLPRREEELISRVKQLQVDAADLHMFEDRSIDKLIVSCLLAHLRDPEIALREWKRVLKPGGKIVIYVPSEPSLLLRILREFSTVRKARKRGFDHKSFHYREHVNNYFLMKILLKEMFYDCKIKSTSYPFRNTPFDLTLWRIFEVDIK